jgi:hypothetical protein
MIKIWIMQESSSNVFHAVGFSVEYTLSSRMSSKMRTWWRLELAIDS